jgi:RNA polymerase sigma factor (sigma-70 family)
MVLIGIMMRKAKSALLRRGLGHEDADDLVQQAFLKIEDYRRTRPVRSHEAMLVKAAINLSIDHVRRQKRAPFAQGLESVADLFDNSPGPHEMIEARVKLDQVRKGLEQLNEKTRRIILARRLEGVSVSEIARRERMTVAAVEKQIARGTLSLMKWLDGW